jgi:hypothetical protein
VGKEIMEIVYKDFDKQAGVLYIYVGKPRPAISRNLPDGILIRNDVTTGEFVGLTVFDFTAKKEKEYEATLKESSSIPKNLLPQVINVLRKASAKGV